MRTPRFSAALAALLAASLLASFIACGGSSDNPGDPQCSDGKDNDGDGTVDFPDDLGCTGEDDTTEDSSPSPACSDGRDNDGDGKTDFPDDPGCTATQANDESDDCPDGPMCPECGDGVDNDGNGQTDFPADGGCTSASDTDERPVSAVACGPLLMVQDLPVDGVVMSQTTDASLSMIQSPCGGGGGTPAIAYELHLTENKVVEISTDSAMTTFDTVIDVRAMNCTEPEAEIACNDNLGPDSIASQVTTSLRAGSYYIIVQGYDSTESGTFGLTVKFSNGEGVACTAQADCGAGLFCRTPLGGSAMSCEKPMCDDGVDDDGDADGDDWPDDPGCTDRFDNDESDDCPSGPNCPECGDGIDNDTDGQTDYGADTTCSAAGDSSESCVSTDGVGVITQPITTGTTVGASNDYTPTCASTTHAAPDKVFRLDLPPTTRLLIDPTGSNTGVVLLGSTCAGPAVACRTFGAAIDLTNHPAGEYYLVVDGYGPASNAYPFEIAISGTIVNGGSCDEPLAQSGALTCGIGYTCKGPDGNKTCQQSQCSDGINNGDGDALIDYPLDPGCESLGDDTELDPATPPVCKNTVDDDMDGTTDYPADMGCAAAGAMSEAFCTGEVDAAVKITANPTTGTTTGATNNFPTSSCQPSTGGPDKAFGLSVPVFLTSLTIDLSDPGTDFDSVVTLRDTSCATQIGCDDDGGDPGTESKLVVSNVSPGNYAVVVDGYSTNAGAFSMKITGVAADGQPCTDPGFSGGANALFRCETACTANVCN